MRLRAVFLMLLLFASSAACGRKARVQSPRVPAPAPESAQTGLPAPGAQQSPEFEAPPEVSIPKAGPAFEAGRSSSAPAVSSFSGTLPPSPTVRIGLTTSGKEIQITAPDQFYLVEKVPEAPRHTLRGNVTVRVESGDFSEIWRVQVAALSKAAGAEELQRKLTEKLSVAVLIQEHPVSRLHQVRVGAFGSREEAQRFASGALAEAGYAEYLVVRETVGPGGRSPRLALRGPGSLFRVSGTGYLFSPFSSTDFLRVNGKPYRGLLDLSLNSNGRITVVNQVEVEEYLLGVVPAEISPATYPEFAALAAQSVAARTYALKNRGRFRSEGFDLTADERTQVYGGVNAEKEATNAAVLHTFGLALYYRNQIIDAMYSSTCGGRTEDFSEVFDAPEVPYLKSVFCSIESAWGEGLETRIDGSHDLETVVYSGDVGIANRLLALARVLGLIETSPISPDYLGSPPRTDEVRNWIGRARTIANTDKGESAVGGDIVSRAGFIRYAAESLFGAPDIESRISTADANYYLGNLKDGGDVPVPSRPALAYLMQAGLWRADFDNRARPNDPIRRQDALSLLAAWIESIRPEILQKGLFAGGERTSAQKHSSRSIAVKLGNRTREFPLSGDLRLFSLAAGRSTPVDTLKVIGNERLGFHMNSSGQIDFLEVELNPAGASSDRYSPAATWNVTFSRSMIAEKLGALVKGLGDIIDLKPSRIGKSGRAVQMQIVGSRNSSVLNGYRFRNALGLKDTLFTIARAKNPEGAIESFTFNGRGWGHGVGMCQVGAFGMARAGLGFEEILKTYYQGVEIQKAY